MSQEFKDIEENLSGLIMLFRFIQMRLTNRWPEVWVLVTVSWQGMKVELSPSIGNFKILCVHYSVAKTV